MSRAASRRDVVKAVTRQLLAAPEDRALWVRRLAAFMVERKLTDQADLVINDIASELQRQAGVLTAEVVSARQLGDELRAGLQELLRRETGAETVVLHETTDQALLGGFVARTPDAELDASVRNTLRKLSALA